MNDKRSDSGLAGQHGLSELELDALTELVNIGIGRSAIALRELAGDEVLLTVPQVVIISPEQASTIIHGSNAHPLIAVRQSFQGEFSGCALLIFPEPNSLQLVRAVTRSQLMLEDIVELEQEALAEIGNIILNGCMATIANLLERSLTMALPEILRGSALDFFLIIPCEAQNEILFVRIEFSIRGQEISGYVAIVLDFLSLSALHLLVADFIRRAAG